MAQLLQHQDSGFYGKEMQGRRWSFLQFFGLRRRPRSMKMLSDKKHGQEKSTGGSRLRGCYVPLKDEESGVTDDHENTQATNDHKGSKKNSGKSSLRSLIARKLYGKEGQKEKMLPVAPRLLRTLSIHYLETNVYVFEAASKGDGSSHGAKSSQKNPTTTNLQHSTLEGSDSDMNFSQLISTGEEHVKRKSHRSISMDGILHKVPYGQKVSGETILEELPRSASATYDRDCLKHYAGTAPGRHLNQGFGRSRSLHESLESYSHLLDSISSSEAKRVLTSSKSTRNHSLESKGLTRFAEYLVIPEDSSPWHALEKNVVDGDVKSSVEESSCNEAAGGSDNPVSHEEYSGDERGVAAWTEADLCVAPLPSKVADVSEEHTAATCDDDQVLSSTETNDIPEEDARTCADDLIHSSADPDPCTLLRLLQSEDSDNAEQHATPSDDHTLSCTAQPSEDITVAEEHVTVSNQIQSFEGTCCVPHPNQDSEDELNLSCEQETESPTCVLDVDFSDHHASSELDDSSSLEENIFHSNEADDSVGSDDLDAQENNFSDLNDLQVADPKDADVLNYVKDIFIKSSFATEPLFDAWRSHNMAALQKEDCQHNDLCFSAASASDLAMADMSADEFLLFDLTNEALLDMYMKYDAADRGSNRCRPKPVGERAMKELWGKVSCQLDEQPRFGVDVDGILSSDLAKADRWVEFRGDGDEVRDKVADFVLDRLITELALQLLKF